MFSNELPGGVVLERLLETVEMAQNEDLFQALPGNVAREEGLDLRREDGTLVLTARGWDHPMFNRVQGVGIGEDGAAADPVEVLERAARHYQSAGIRRWMVQLLPHVESNAFREAAERRGMVRLRGWAKHVGDANRDVPSRTELRVVRLGEEEDRTAEELAEAWADIVVRNFGLPASFGPWLRALHGRDRWHLYVALDGETPVATGALYLSDTEFGSIGQLTFASTLPEHRRRGAQSALVARRVADAGAAGARWVVCETDEEVPARPNPSTRNLVRLGFPVSYVRANWGPPKPTG